MFNSFHPSLLQFAQFTAQQLLIMSSHHLSLQYCLLFATCLCTHLKMAITEVLMIRGAKVVISFSLALSFSLPSSSLAGYFTASFTVSDDKFSSHFCKMHSLSSYFPVLHRKGAHCTVIRMCFMLHCHFSCYYRYFGSIKLGVAP